MLARNPPHPLRLGPELGLPCFGCRLLGVSSGRCLVSPPKVHVLNHKLPARVAATFVFLTPLLMTLEQKALDDIFIAPSRPSFPGI